MLIVQISQSRKKKVSREKICYILFVLEGSSFYYCSYIRLIPTNVGPTRSTPYGYATSGNISDAGRCLGRSVFFTVLRPVLALGQSATECTPAILVGQAQGLPNAGQTNFKIFQKPD